MRPTYLEAIEWASRILARAFIEDLETVLGYGARLDQEVQGVVCEVGRGVLGHVYGAVESDLVAQSQEVGWWIERHPRVSFKTLFGVVEVKSPYLWKPGEGKGLRPMKAVMGVAGGGMSVGVERALVEFGSEKSFERAAKQFLEHYGFEVGRGTVLGHTEACAEEAERYVEERLTAAVEHDAPPPAEPPEVGVLVVELDGCEIRTGVFMTGEQAGREGVESQAEVRVERWREVRTGWVRPLTEIDRTYVGRMASYPEICAQL